MDCISAASNLKNLLVAHGHAEAQVSALGKFYLIFFLLFHLHTCHNLTETKLYICNPMSQFSSDYIFQINSFINTGRHLLFSSFFLKCKIRWGTASNFHILTLLHSDWPKLYGVLAILSAIELKI